LSTRTSKKSSKGKQILNKINPRTPDSNVQVFAGEVATVVVVAIEVVHKEIKLMKRRKKMMTSRLSRNQKSD
jgi:hypothetical protein